MIYGIHEIPANGSTSRKIIDGGKKMAEDLKGLGRAEELQGFPLKVSTPVVRTGENRRPRKVMENRPIILPSSKS